MPTTEGVESIRKERIRQIVEYGYDPKHDHQHAGRELSAFVIAILLFHITPSPYEFNEWARAQPDWVIDNAEKHKDDYEDALRTAGALIAAELDRIEHAKHTP